MPSVNIDTSRSHDKTTQINAKKTKLSTQNICYDMDQRMWFSLAAESATEKLAR